VTRDAPRFIEDRPQDIRTATAWHWYAHHVRVLPERLRALSGDLRVPPGGRVLDYGSAEAPYRSFFRPDAEFVTADLPGNPDASLELNADGTVPAPDESFDAVLSTQVLEHVPDPQLYLSECFRVLRPGGRMLLSTHGIFIYHPDPEDYWRWTAAGLRHAVGRPGFEVVRFEGIIGLMSTGLQLVQDATYDSLPGRARPLVALVMQTLIRLADRLQSQETRDLNAQVFALVASKPGPGQLAGGP
jgi:SAM-dependent methyltransferase